MKVNFETRQYQLVRMNWQREIRKYQPVNIKSQNQLTIEIHQYPLKKDQLTSWNSPISTSNRLLTEINWQLTQLTIDKLQLILLGTTLCKGGFTLLVVITLQAERIYLMQPGI